MRERRKYVRIDLCVDVGYKLVSESKQPFVSNTKNISEGGMCFLANDKFKAGDVLNLTFRLPNDNGAKDKREINCQAEVAWQLKGNNGYLTGIKFIDLDLDKRVLIETFISKFISSLTKHRPY